MPNNKGGRNFKKGKKTRVYEDKKQLIKKDVKESQEYAQVVNPKGNGRFELLCFDGGKTRMGTICGTMRKRVWVNRSDVVLISLWEGMTDDTKCSIIHKYSEDEAKRLQKEGELPDTFKFNLDEFATPDDEEYGFTMDDPSDSSAEKEGINLDDI